VTTLVVSLAVLAVGTYAMKLAGLLVGGREGETRRANPVLDLLPAALLAALVAVQTLTDGAALVVDARIAGVAAAGLAVALRAPFALVVLAGVAVTAGLRAAGWG
jgi:uncharacterized membrane protein